MQLRWTEAAVRDLELIADYLVEQAPDRAAALGTNDLRRTHRAAEFPNRGRLGKKAGTRELVLSPLPYLVYTVRGDVIYVARILHGAQRWP